MTDSVAFAEFKQGVRLLRDARPSIALEHFRKAAVLEKHNPYYISFVGVSWLVQNSDGSMPWNFARRPWV